MDMCSPFGSSFPGTQVTINEEGEKGEELMIRVVELCQEEELDGGFSLLSDMRGSMKRVFTVGGSSLTCEAFDRIQGFLL